MQFRVPQNITMEDRIIGSLTAIQFAILVIGGGLAFLIFTSTQVPKPINQVVGGLIALITVLLSLGKFNGQPMYRFFKYILSFIFTPKTRAWHKEGAPEVELIKKATKRIEKDPRASVKVVRKADIEQLAAVIDSRGQIGVVPELKKPEEPKN